MRTFAEKPKATHQAASSTPTASAPAHLSRSHQAGSIQYLQRTIGNQSLQQQLQAGARQVTSVQRSTQPTLKVGSPGDTYEQEADQVADQVMRMNRPAKSKTDEPVSYPAPQGVTTHIPPGSSLGEPLDIGTNEEMSRNFGFDLSNVRVHTGDPAVYLNRRLNARAFTYGSDIFFNKGEYDPHSFTGKKLLAHELTHVVQQSRMGADPQRKMIQCTTIGEILDEFFSPFSSPRLWIMPESDPYTVIVRRWQPVIDAVNRAKANLEANCTGWSTNHRTDPAWRPGMTDPPVTDPNAHREFVPSPPGTDPATCRSAFIPYVATRVTPGVPLIQTFELYTCSIGSFNIYVTVDSIDCAAGLAKMNIWMYNAMSVRSFGRYASHPVFALSGMEKQYMWWNWSESHSWSPAPPAPAPVVPTRHTVVRGDTMSAIARRHGVSLGDLIAANPQVRNPNLIHPGDVLNIP